MKKFTKLLIIFLFIGGILFISCDGVSAKNCPECGTKMKETKTVIDPWDGVSGNNPYKGIVKYNGTYQRKYVYEIESEYQCQNDSVFLENFGYDFIGYAVCSRAYNYDYITFEQKYETKYKPAKKGDVVSKKTKYVKKKEKNGKLLKVYKTTKTVVTSPTKLKTTTKIINEVFAYYKKIKVPKLKIGKWKWYKIYGARFTIGRTVAGYYINHLEDIYKIKGPAGYYLYGAKHFYKKPSYLKVYV